MHLSELFSPKKNSFLIGHEDKFYLFQDLLINKRMPKVLMLSGRKGIGKFTLINHLMHYYFDKENYDEKDFRIIDDKSLFRNMYNNNLFPNIFYLNSSSFLKVRMDDIRILKENLLKTSINNLQRFIIFDGVENFNVNSLNALLKIIEEPSKNTHFILINNKTKPLIETIRSRCLEIKIILNNSNRNKIISFLLKQYKQELILEKDLVNIEPGMFLKFNFLFSEKKLNLEDGFVTNLEKIMNLFKKEKDFLYRDLLIFLTEYYFQKNKASINLNNNKFMEKKLSIFKNINDFFVHNLNQNTFIHSIQNTYNE